MEGKLKDDPNQENHMRQGRRFSGGLAAYKPFFLFWLTHRVGGEFNRFTDAVWLKVDDIPSCRQ